MNKYVDTHVHLWKYSPKEFSWITENLKILKQNFLFGDYQKINTSNTCVLVQARQSTEETDLLCDVANENKSVLGVVGWVNLFADDFEEQVKTYSRSSKYKKLVGFRHLIQDETDPHFMLRPQFASAMKTLHKYGYPFDVLVKHYQLPQFVDYLYQSKHEKQPVFILDHLAKPTIDGTREEFLTWKDHVKKIASFENVYCKISGLLTEGNLRGRRVTSAKPFVEYAIDLFGIERIMIGSDWPVCLLKGSFQESINIVNRLGLKLDSQSLEKITYENAMKIYGKR